ncbi:MAG: hypothetical protein U0U69_12300 [Acidimicrobiia bacterium]
MAVRLDSSPGALAAGIIATHSATPGWLDSFEDAFAVGRGGELGLTRTRRHDSVREDGAIG